MPAATPRQNERRYLWTIATWLFLALCLFAVIHLLAPVCNSATGGAVSLSPSPSAAPPGADPATNAATELAAATERRKAEESRAIARVRLQRLRQGGDEVIVLCRQFEQECDQFAALTASLLADERGKRVASDVEAVEAFRALIQNQRAPRLLAEQVRANVQALLNPIDAALKADDSAYVPSDHIVAAIAQEQARVTSALEEYQRARRQADGLVLSTSNREPGEALSMVLQQIEAIEARQQSRAVAAARAEATTEVRQQVAVAEGEKVREIGRSETAKVKAEEDAEQARIDAEALRVRQQGERDRLLKLAKDPAVQARFAPFLATGRRYPARYEGSVRWLERKPWGRTPPRPVSLKELSTGGVFDNLQNFVVAAASSKSKTGAQNDRPHWPMPSTVGDWAMLKADFELFQQLAPVWVELNVIPAD